MQDRLPPDRQKPLATRGRTIDSRQSRYVRRRPAPSGLPQSTDILGVRRHVSSVPIVLQKSQTALRLIFRQRAKQATIADQCGLKPGTGVACEFGAWRRSLPHHFSIAAPTTRKI
jgi:hypothetical protein